MHILFIVLIGFFIGVVAKLLMPGANDPKGFLITSLLGIAGAFVASYIGQSMGYYGAGQPSGFLASVLGAMLLLALYHLATRRTA